MNLQNIAENRELRIVAIMPLARYAPTAPIPSTLNALAELNIPIVFKTGAYVAQNYDWLFRHAIDKLNADIILTIEHDVLFNSNHVVTLLNHLMDCKYDVIFSLIAQRERTSNSRIFAQSFIGYPVIKAGDCFEDTNLLPVSFGHFGLSVFNAHKIKTLQFPLFLEQPNEDGVFEKGKMDYDLYFWQNLSAAGCESACALDVRVGHLCEMVVYIPEGKNISVEVTDSTSYLNDILPFSK